MGAGIAGVINGAAWFEINGEMADWNYRYAGCLETTIEFTQSKTPNAFGMDQAWTENETSLKTYMGRDSARDSWHGALRDHRGTVEREHSDLVAGCDGAADYAGDGLECGKPYQRSPLTEAST